MNPEAKLSASSAANRVKAFKKYLLVGQDCLREKNYANALMVFGGLLTDLSHQDLQNALCLTFLEVYSLHTCLMYCAVQMKHHPYNTLGTLYDGIFSQSEILLPLIHYLKAQLHLEVKQLDLVQNELKMCANMIDKGYNFKPNAMLNDELVPEIDDLILRQKLIVMASFCEFISASGNLENEGFMKLEVVNKNGDDEFLHILKGTKLKSTATQTEHTPKKCKSTDTQTVAKKFSNSACQTTKEKVPEPSAENKKITNSLNDIRAICEKMQSKKDNELKQLQAANQALQKKVAMLEKQVQIQKITADYSKDSNKALNGELNAKQGKIDYLQKVLVQQMQTNCETQAYIYEMYQKEFNRKFQYFNSLNKVNLTSFSFISNRKPMIEAERYNKYLAQLVAHKNNFKTFFNDLMNNIMNNALNVNFCWPAQPKFIDEEDCIYQAFMEFAKTFEIRSPSQDSVSKRIPHEVRLGSQSPKICNEITQKKQEKAPPQRLKQSATSSQASSSSSVASFSFLTPDEELVSYLFEEFASTAEVTLFPAIIDVRDQLQGDLNSVPRLVLVKMIRARIKSSDKQPCESEFDDKDKCIICFDEYTTQNSRKLKCGHSFHGKCIKSWLKRQRACPICRVHVLENEEFPPLR